MTAHYSLSAVEIGNFYFVDWKSVLDMLQRSPCAVGSNLTLSGSFVDATSGGPGTASLMDTVQGSPCLVGNDTSWHDAIPHLFLEMLLLETGFHAQATSKLAPQE